MRTPRIFAAVFMMIALSACGSWTRLATGETESALCDVWQDSLPTRSRQDTERTQREIQVAYADFLNACPGGELP